MKPDEYRCELCGGVFAKAWTDEEAEAELHARFPGHETVACSVVCDDCYRTMLKD